MQLFVALVFVASVPWTTCIHFGRLSTRKPRDLNLISPEYFGDAGDDPRRSETFYNKLERKAKCTLKESLEFGEGNISPEFAPLLGFVQSDTLKHNMTETSDDKDRRDEHNLKTFKTEMNSRIQSNALETSDVKYYKDVAVHVYDDEWLKLDNQYKEKLAERDLLNGRQSLFERQQDENEEDSREMKEKQGAALKSMAPEFKALKKEFKEKKKTFKMWKLVRKLYGEQDKCKAEFTKAIDDFDAARTKTGLLQTNTHVSSASPSQTIDLCRSHSGKLVAYHRHSKHHHALDADFANRLEIENITTAESFVQLFTIGGPQEPPVPQFKQPPPTPPADICSGGVKPSCVLVLNDVEFEYTGAKRLFDDVRIRKAEMKDAHDKRKQYYLDEIARLNKGATSLSSFVAEVDRKKINNAKSISDLVTEMNDKTAEIKSFVKNKTDEILVLMKERCKWITLRNDVLLAAKKQDKSPMFAKLTKECLVDDAYGRWGTDDSVCVSRSNPDEEFNCDPSPDCKANEDTCSDGTVTWSLDPLSNPKPEHCDEYKDFVVHLEPMEKDGHCNKKACPVDASYKPWTSWSTCEIEGVQERKRDIVEFSSHGGTMLDSAGIGGLNDIKQCFPEPPKCRWRDWSMPSLCSGDCGTNNIGWAYRTRSKYQSSPHADYSLDCNKEEPDYEEPETQWFECDVRSCAEGAVCVEPIDTMFVLDGSFLVTKDLFELYKEIATVTRSKTEFTYYNNMRRYDEVYTGFMVSGNGLGGSENVPALVEKPRSFQRWFDGFNPVYLGGQYTSNNDIDCGTGPENWSKCLEKAVQPNMLPNLGEAITAVIGSDWLPSNSFWKANLVVIAGAHQHWDHIQRSKFVVDEGVDFDTQFSNRIVGVEITEECPDELPKTGGDEEDDVDKPGAYTSSGKTKEGIVKHYYLGNKCDIPSKKKAAADKVAAQERKEDIESISKALMTLYCDEVVVPSRAVCHDPDSGEDKDKAKEAGTCGGGDGKSSLGCYVDVLEHWHSFELDLIDVDVVEESDASKHYTSNSKVWSEKSSKYINLTTIGDAPRLQGGRPTTTSEPTNHRPENDKTWFYEAYAWTREECVAQAPICGDDSQCIYRVRMGVTDQSNDECYWETKQMNCGDDRKGELVVPQGVVFHATDTCQYAHRKNHCTLGDEYEKESYVQEMTHEDGEISCPGSCFTRCVVLPRVPLLKNERTYVFEGHEKWKAFAQKAFKARSERTRLEDINVQETISLATKRWPKWGDYWSCGSVEISANGPGCHFQSSSTVRTAVSIIMDRPACLYTEF